MTNQVLESLNNQARDWASQFDFAMVGDRVHVVSARPKWGPDGKAIDADTFFDTDQQESFPFSSAMESFVNHQHPFHDVDPASLPEQPLYRRRFVELCATHLQRIADEALPHHAVCVIPERYNEVVTAVTVRPGNTQDPEELIRCLAADEDEVRYEAAIAAGSYMVREAVSDLERVALKDPNLDVSSAAAESLIELADKASLPAMRRVWSEQKAEEHILRTAAFLLTTFGDVETLTTGLERGSSLTPNDWADIVVHLPAEESVLPLIDRLMPLTAEGVDLRWALGEAISALGAPGLEYARGLLASPDAATRQVGCCSLFDPEAVGARELAENRLRTDPSPAVRYAAFIGLERMGRPESFAALTAALGDLKIFPTGSGEAETGLQRYLRRNPQLDIRPLLARFTSEDVGVRMRVLISLEEIESGEQRLDAMSSVEAGLGDPAPSVRSEAVFLASLLNFADMRDRVQQIAWTDPDESVREEAEQSLADWYG